MVVRELKEVPLVATNVFLTILLNMETKYKKHWAESLEMGDRCKATIRHQTDGTKNIHNADIIVIKHLDKAILAAFDGNEVVVPYNELILTF